MDAKPKYHNTRAANLTGCSRKTPRCRHHRSRLAPHPSREEDQPAPSDLLIGRPEGNHIGADAKDDMEVVGEYGEGRDRDAEEAGEGLQADPDPGPAMIVGVARELIDAAERRLRTSLSW